MATNGPFDFAEARSASAGGERTELLLSAWLERDIPPRTFLLGNSALHHVPVACIWSNRRRKDPFLFGFSRGRSGRVRIFELEGERRAKACDVSRRRASLRDF